MAGDTARVVDERAKDGEDPGDLTMRDEVVEAVELALVLEEVAPCREEREFEVFEVNERAPRDDEKEFKVAELPFEVEELRILVDTD